MAKYFVTGASGFVGSNLVRKLISEGNEVVALLRKESNHPFLQNLPADKFKRVEGNVTDYSYVLDASKNCDYAIHCAAKIAFNRFDFNDIYLINVLGSRYVAHACLENNIKRMVHVSTAAVFGVSQTTIPMTESAPDIVPPTQQVYPFTKKIAERELEHGIRNGMDGVIVNPTTIYGQGDRWLNSGFLIKNIYNEKMKFAPPGGTNVVSVDDVVDGILLALQKGRSGEKYILSGRNMTYLELYNKIAEVLGKKKVSTVLPKFLRTPAFYGAMGLELISHLQKKNSLITSQIVGDTFGYKYYDNSRAKQELGWEPKVPFETAVRNAFEFYKTNGQI